MNMPIGIGFIFFGIASLIMAFVLPERMIGKVLACFAGVVLLGVGVISLIPSKKYDVTVHFIETDTYMTFTNVQVIDDNNSVSLILENGERVYLSNVTILKR